MMIKLDCAFEINKIKNTFVLFCLNRIQVLIQITRKTFNKMNRKNQTCEKIKKSSRN
jgi:hypothetical protein